MKITDLNIDCLEAILNYLDFQDLINAADANKRIKHAAKFVFAEKYSDLKLVFRVLPPSMRLIIPNPEIDDRSMNLFPNHVDVHDLKIALQLLRCFGCVMKKIQLKFSKTVYNQYITSYINQFCADSITKFNITDIPEGGLNYFTQPFTRIEKVRFETYEGEYQLAENDWLNRLFPKMKKLKVSSVFKCSALFENGDTVNHFPHLEHLVIIKRKIFGPGKVCRENILKTLKLNPQLKKLRVKCTECGLNQILGADFFHSAEYSLQNLESLHMTMHFNTFFHKFEFETLRLKNVKHLRVEFNRYSTAGSIVFPFYFPKLETLRCHEKFSDRCYRFIKKHPTISTLYLTSNVEQSVDVKRYKKIFPSVTEIKCDKIDFIKAMSNSLKVFTLGIEDDRQMHLILKSIQTNFNEEWTLSIHKKRELYYSSGLMSYYVKGIKKRN